MFFMKLEDRCKAKEDAYNEQLFEAINALRSELDDYEKAQLLPRK